MSKHDILILSAQLLPHCREHIFNNESGTRALGIDTGNLEEKAADLAIKQAKALLKAYKANVGDADEC